MTEVELRFQLRRRDLSDVARRRIEANLAGDFSEGRWMIWTPVLDRSPRFDV